MAKKPDPRNPRREAGAKPTVKVPPPPRKPAGKRPKTDAERLDDLLKKTGTNELDDRLRQPGDKDD